MPIDFKKLNFKFNPYAGFQQSAEPQLNQKQMALQRLAQANMQKEVANREAYNQANIGNIPYEEWVKLQSSPKKDMMSATKPTSKADKLLEILKNPVTAAQYAINKQPIPNNLSGNRNIYDYATDVLNPAFYGKAITNTAGNIVDPQTYKDLAKTALYGATALTGDEASDLEAPSMRTFGRAMDAAIALPALKGLRNMFPKAGTNLFEQPGVPQGWKVEPNFEQPLGPSQTRQPLALTEGQRKLEAPTTSGLSRQQKINFINDDYFGVPGGDLEQGINTLSEADLNKAYELAKNGGENAETSIYDLIENPNREMQTYSPGQSMPKAESNAPEINTNTDISNLTREQKIEHIVGDYFGYPGTEIEDAVKGLSDSDLDRAFEIARNEGDELDIYDILEGRTPETNIPQAAQAPQATQSTPTGQASREEMVASVQRMAAQTGFNPAHVNSLTDQELSTLASAANDENAFMEAMTGNAVDASHPIHNDEEYLNNWLINGAHPEDLYGPLESSSVTPQGQYASEEELNSLLNEGDLRPAGYEEPEIQIPNNFDTHRNDVINNLLNNPGLDEADRDLIRSFNDVELFFNHEFLSPNEHAQMFGSGPESTIQVPSVSGIGGVMTQGMTIPNPRYRTNIINELSSQTADSDEIDQLRRLSDEDLLDIYAGIHPESFDDLYRNGEITGGNYTPSEIEPTPAQVTPQQNVTSSVPNTAAQNQNLNEEERAFLQHYYDNNARGMSTSPTDEELINFYNGEAYRPSEFFPINESNNPGDNFPFIDNAIRKSGSQGLYKFRDPKVKEDIIAGVKKEIPGIDVSSLENAKDANEFAVALENLTNKDELRKLTSKYASSNFLPNSIRYNQLNLPRFAANEESPRSVEDLKPTENGYILNNGLKFNKISDNIYEAKLGDKSYGLVDKLFNQVNKEGHILNPNSTGILDKISEGLYLRDEPRYDKIYAEDSYGGGEINMRKTNIDAFGDDSYQGDPTWKFFMNMPESLRAGKSMAALEKLIKKGEFVGQPSSDSYSYNSYFANLARGKNPDKWEPVQKGYIETNTMARNNIEELAEQGILANNSYYSNNGVLKNIKKQFDNKLNTALQNQKIDENQKRILLNSASKVNTLINDLGSIGPRPAMKKDANRLFNEFKKEIKTHAPELLKQLGITSSRSYSSLARLGAENAAKAIDDKIKKQLPNANIGPVKVVDDGAGDFRLRLPNIHYKKLFSILGAGAFIEAFGQDTYDDMMSGKFDKPNVSSSTLKKLKK